MENKYEIAFNTNFVASLTGATVTQLNNWDKMGLVSPSLLKSSGRGSIRLYSFKDIVEAKTVAHLRANRISLKEIKKAVEYLKSIDYSRPLTELCLISNGVDVLCAPDSEMNDICAKWLAANKYGQLVMPFVVPLGAITQSIDEAIKLYNERIEETLQAREENKLISLEDIEGKVFGVSNKTKSKCG